VPYDEKTGLHTHDLLVSDVVGKGTYLYNNIEYYKFVLDANQTANDPISLIDLRVYVTPSALTTKGSLTALFNNGAPVISMNAGTDTYRVDIHGDTGSGSGDMFVYVPASVIGNSGNLYLYSAFGLDAAGGGYKSDDGFEEWWHVSGTKNNTPDGGLTVLMLGSALVALGAIGRRIKK